MCILWYVRMYNLIRTTDFCRLVHRVLTCYSFPADGHRGRMRYRAILDIPFSHSQSKLVHESGIFRQFSIQKYYHLLTVESNHFISPYIHHLLLTNRAFTTDVTGYKTDFLSLSHSPLCSCFSFCLQW